MASVKITDAAGQAFNIQGCTTVAALKDSILEHTGIPVEKQRLTRAAAKDIELVNTNEIGSEEELELLVADMNGGCEVKPFFIKIQVR